MAASGANRLCHRGSCGRGRSGCLSGAGDRCRAARPARWAADRPLGPLSIDIDAPRDVVFAVVAAPYADRVPKAMRQKVRVLERGSDMVLAAHYTPIAGRLRATTVETVRFQRPSRVHFSLVRGPVPYVKETFDLDEDDGQTVLSYHGELATDLWAPGRWWGNVVAARWEAVVSSSFDTIKEQAERRGKERGV